MTTKADSDCMVTPSCSDDVAEYMVYFDIQNGLTALATIGNVNQLLRCQCYYAPPLGKSIHSSKRTLPGNNHKLSFPTTHLLLVIRVFKQT